MADIDVNSEEFKEYLQSAGLTLDDYNKMTPMAAAAVERGFREKSASKEQGINLETDLEKARNDMQNELSSEEIEKLNATWQARQNFGERLNAQQNLRQPMDENNIRSAAERDEAALDAILNDENYTEEEKELAMEIAVEAERERLNNSDKEPEENNEFEFNQTDDIVDEQINEDETEQETDNAVNDETELGAEVVVESGREDIWATIPSPQIKPEDYGLDLDKALALVNDGNLNDLSNEELLAVHSLIAASTGNAEALGKVQEAGRNRLAAFVTANDGFRIQNAPALKEMIGLYGYEGESYNDRQLSEEGAKAQEKLIAAVRAYDAENGLEGLTPENAEEINRRLESIQEEIDKINISQKPQEGERDEFAEARTVLENLDFRDEKGKPVSKDEAGKLRDGLINAAKLEAIKNLTVSGEEITPEAVQKALAEELEIAVYNTVTMDKTNGAGDKNFPGKAREAVQAWARLGEGSKIKVSAATVQAQYAVTHDRAQGFAGRLGQRIGKTTGLDKYASRIKAFDEKHKDNKNYQRAKSVLKFIGNGVKGYALYTVAGMTAPVGMAALMGYNTIKSIKNIRKAYKASEEKSFWQYFKKNKVQVLAQSTGMLASAVGLGGSLGDAVNTFGIQGGDMLNQFMQNPAMRYLSQNRVVLGMTAGIAPKAGNVFSRLADVAQGKATWKDVGKEFKDLVKTTAALGAGMALNQSLGIMAQETGLNDAIHNLHDSSTNDSQTQEGNAVDQPVESKENLERWDARNDKFLGAELKEGIYDLVENGEIKLPEGIESKEEFAYKYAMLRELAPVAQAEAIQNIETMLKGGELTPEQFQNIQTAMGHIADTGEYSGPGRTVVNENQHGGNDNRQHGGDNTQSDQSKIDNNVIENALSGNEAEIDGRNQQALRSAIYAECVMKGMSPEEAGLVADNSLKEFNALRAEGKDFEAKELMHTLSKELSEYEHKQEVKDFLHGDENDSNRVDRLQGKAIATNEAYHQAEQLEAKTRAELEAAQASGDRSAIIRAQEAHGDALKDLAHLREDFIKDNVNLAEATYKNDINTAEGDIKRLEQLENKINRLDDRIDNKEGRLRDINTPDADAEKHEANKYERQTDRNLNKLDRIERLEAKQQDALREMAEISGLKITNETTVEDVLRASEAHKADMREQIGISERSLDRVKNGDYSQIPTLNGVEDHYSQSHLGRVVTNEIVGMETRESAEITPLQQKEVEMTLKEQKVEPIQPQQEEKIDENMSMKERESIETPLQQKETEIINPNETQKDERQETKVENETQTINKQEEENSGKPQELENVVVNRIDGVDFGYATKGDTLVINGGYDQQAKAEISNNIRMTQNTATGEISVEGSDKTYSSVTEAERAREAKAGSLAKESLVYRDLHNRMENGYTPNEVESSFLHGHEERMAKIGMGYDEDGKMTIQESKQADSSNDKNTEKEEKLTRRQLRALREGNNPNLTTENKAPETHKQELNTGRVTGMRTNQSGR